MTYWFTSDTHFFHKNIIQYCDRPFRDIEEMNAYLIEQWNSQVSKGDIVFHLGDFFMGKYTDWFNVEETLNGTIILIKGNHDKEKRLREVGIKHFATEAYITIGSSWFWLNHYPSGKNPYDNIERRPRQKRFCDIILHGHCHSKPEQRIKVLRRRPVPLISIDVGVDGNNLKLWSAKDLIEEAQKYW